MLNCMHFLLVAVVTCIRSSSDVYIFHLTHFFIFSGFWFSAFGRIKDKVIKLRFVSKVFLSYLIVCDNFSSEIQQSLKFMCVSLLQHHRCFTVDNMFGTDGRSVKPRRYICDSVFFNI